MTDRKPAADDNGSRTGPPNPDRDSRGRFASGNRAAVGRRSRADSLRAALGGAVTEDDVAMIAKSLLKRALAGDVPACVAILDRVCGKPRIAPADNIALDFEADVSTAAGALAAVGAVVGAVTSGDLSPTDAQMLVGIVAEARRAGAELHDWRDDRNDPLGHDDDVSADPTFM